MMTMKQIIALLKCSRWKAMKILSEAGIKPTIVPSHSKSNNGGGIKHAYDLTAAKVLELKDTNEKRDPDIVAIQQGMALSALESTFFNIQNAHNNRNGSPNDNRPI
jgi:hypothetical protein